MRIYVLGDAIIEATYDGFLRAYLYLFYFIKKIAVFIWHTKKSSNFALDGLMLSILGNWAFGR